MEPRSVMNIVWIGWRELPLVWNWQYHHWPTWPQYNLFSSLLQTLDQDCQNGKIHFQFESCTLYHIGIKIICIHVHCVRPWNGYEDGKVSILIKFMVPEVVVCHYCEMEDQANIQSYKSKLGVVPWTTLVTIKILRVSRRSWYIKVIGLLTIPDSFELKYHNVIGVEECGCMRVDRTWRLPAIKWAFLLFITSSLKHNYMYTCSHHHRSSVSNICIALNRL